MNKIDTSPNAIRELINREVSRSNDDYYSQACKLHDALQMLAVIVEEKEAAEKCTQASDVMRQRTTIDAAIMGEKS